MRQRHKTKFFVVYRVLVKVMDCNKQLVLIESLLDIATMKR